MKKAMRMFFATIVIFAVVMSSALVATSEDVLSLDDVLPFLSRDDVSFNGADKWSYYIRNIINENWPVEELEYWYDCVEGIPLYFKARMLEAKNLPQDIREELERDSDVMNLAKFLPARRRNKDSVKINAHGTKMFFLYSEFTPQTAELLLPLLGNVIGKDWSAEELQYWYKEVIPELVTGFRKQIIAYCLNCSLKLFWRAIKEDPGTHYMAVHSKNKGKLTDSMIKYLAVSPKYYVRADCFRIFSDTLSKYPEFVERRFWADRYGKVTQAIVSTYKLPRACYENEVNNLLKGRIKETHPVVARGLVDSPYTPQDFIDALGKVKIIRVREILSRSGRASLGIKEDLAKDPRPWVAFSLLDDEDLPTKLVDEVGERMVSYFQQDEASLIWGNFYSLMAHKNTSEYIKKRIRAVIK